MVSGEKDHCHLSWIGSAADRKRILWSESISRERIRQLDGVIALHREQKKEIERIFQVKEEKIKVTGVGYNDKIFFKLVKKRRRKNRFRLYLREKFQKRKGSM